MSVDPAGWTATALAQLLHARDVSPVELVEAALARIERMDGRVGAFVRVLPERARAQAGEAEARRARNQTRSALDGVPVAVKDLGDRVEGVTPTLGCPALRLPPACTSSLLVGRLEAAGCVVVGTTNVSELGHRCTTDNRLHGPTSSPFAPGVLNAGGSSGGSAAAVAAGMVPVAIGSDGAGSIRVPAALCGTVGLKPTFGLVPNVPRPNGFRNGALFVSAGPLTRTVADVELVLDVLSGPHPADPFSLPAASNLTPRAVTRDSPREQVRVGLVTGFGGFPVEPEVVAAVELAAAALADGGEHAVEPCDLRLPVPVDELVAVVRRAVGSSQADVVAGLVDQGALPADPDAALDPTLQALLAEARGASTERWRVDGVVRTRVLEEIERALARFDLLLTPVTSVASVPNAPAGVTVGPAVVAGRSVDPLYGWCLTWPFNLTGHPAVALPAARVGVAPVGVQLVGPRFADRRVLAAAAALERAAPWQGWYQELDPTGSEEVVPCPS